MREYVVSNTRCISDAVVQEHDTIARNVLDDHLSVEFHQSILVDGFDVVVDEESFDFFPLKCFDDFVHRLKSWKKREKKYKRVLFFVNDVGLLAMKSLQLFWNFWCLGDMIGDI